MKIIFYGSIIVCEKNGKNWNVSQTTNDIAWVIFESSTETFCRGGIGVMETIIGSFRICVYGKNTFDE